MVQGSHILAFADSSIILGWMHKASFDPVNSESTKIKTDPRESLIGKLNHAAHVVPPARYFFDRLRQLLKRGKQWGPQRLQIWHCLDLQLWMKFFQHVTTKGFPINNTVFVKPSLKIWSDACEYGMGATETMI